MLWVHFAALQGLGEQLGAGGYKRVPINSDVTTLTQTHSLTYNENKKGVSKISQEKPKVYSSEFRESSVKLAVAQTVRVLGVNLAYRPRQPICF